MNHKRRRPKNQRAGCLMCKVHKSNGLSEKAKAWGKPELMRAWVRLRDAFN